MVVFASLVIGCGCNEAKVGLTSGVKRNLMPLTDPFRVSPRIRKMARTTYGKVDVTYTA